MKKISYLILLAPSLFLITSCGPKAPVVDGISEKEAREFIEKNFKGPGTIKSAKVSWSGVDLDNVGETNAIKGYTDSSYEIQDSKDSLTINESSPYASRLTQYVVADLASESPMNNSGTDAVAGLDTTIFEFLYKSDQNAPDKDEGAYLTYKKENGGLIIKSIAYKGKHTRVHTYDSKGRETSFSVDIKQDTLAYSVSITFKY